MADLHYFPLLAGDWLAGEAVSMMSPEQEGAFFHLLCRQWTSGEPPCSLPNDDGKLAQLSRLGDKWATVGVFVRAQFEEVKGDPTRIRNPKLWLVFREAQQQHRKRVIAGKHGGDTKAANRKRGQVTARQHDTPPSNAVARLEQSPSNALAMPSNQNQNQSQSHKLTTTTGRPPKISGPEVLPKPDCDSLFEKWSAEIGAISYPRFRKAFLVVRSSAAGRAFTIPELLNAIEAYGEWLKEQEDREQGFTSLEKTFASQVPKWVRLGGMPITKNGELTERGRTIGTKALRQNQRGAA